MKKVEGLIVPNVTPFKKDGELDVEGLKQVIEFLQERGVDGFYPCGTLGEGPTMRLEEKKKVLDVVMDMVKGSKVVVVHVGDAVFDNMVELIKYAKDLGVDAVSAITPIFLIPDDKGIKEYFLRLTDVSDLPFFLYNNPPRTGYNLAPNLAVDIMNSSEKVVGIKDSSRNFLQIVSIMHNLPKGKVVFCGTDNYAYPALAIGCVGGVLGGSNVFPELYVELFSSFRNGNFERTKLLQDEIVKLRDVLAKPPIQPFKEAMKLRGVNAGYVRYPLRAMSEEEIEALKKKIEALELSVSLKE
jgi:4-hydroxy-tetrahydrodipicolinate synthase